LVGQVRALSQYTSKHVSAGSAMVYIWWQARLDNLIWSSRQCLSVYVVVVS
jgi:hypothetical protein